MTGVVMSYGVTLRYEVPEKEEGAVRAPRRVRATEGYLRGNSSTDRSLLTGYFALPATTRRATLSPARPASAYRALADLSSIKAFMKEERHRPARQTS